MNPTSLRPLESLPVLRDVTITGTGGAAGQPVLDLAAFRGSRSVIEWLRVVDTSPIASLKPLRDLTNLRGAAFPDATILDHDLNPLYELEERTESAPDKQAP